MSSLLGIVAMGEKEVSSKFLDRSFEKCLLTLLSPSPNSYPPCEKEILKQDYSYNSFFDSY